MTHHHFPLRWPVYKDGCLHYVEGQVFGFITVAGAAVTAICAITLLAVFLFWQFGNLDTKHHGSLVKTSLEQETYTNT